MLALSRSGDTTSNDISSASRGGLGTGYWCLLIVLLTSVVGCGSKLPYSTATVEGTVTYQSKPLTEGRVVFHPEQGTPGPAAVGVIQPDGSFRIKTVDHEGVALGWHRVTVNCSSGVIQKNDQHGSELKIPPSKIPAKYAVAEESPLRFEVKEGRNEWPIVLE
ncbi:MAG: hypothetical protein JW818_18745 [Pirellulales bacterium]|nr:hypothetical protein [Pirellulales bacterium]